MIIIVREHTIIMGEHNNYCEGTYCEEHNLIVKEVEHSNYCLINCGRVRDQNKLYRHKPRTAINIPHNHGSITYAITCNKSILYGNNLH